MMSAVVRRIVVGLLRAWKAMELFILSKFFSGWCERHCKKMLASGGITVNGKNPWDIQVHNKEFYPRVVNSFMLALGETYMEGMWDAEDLPELVYRTGKFRVYRHYYRPYNLFFENLESKLFNLQTRSKAWEVAEQHYNLGNDLYELMLDPYMVYTCAYWKDAADLNQAQIDKMDLIARKLMLKPGMKILDMGCGWGGLCKYLATQYGVSCVGVTVSEEGARYGQKFCAGLPVEIRLSDYRNIGKDEKFDRIVSVGLCEHVGQKNYKDFFDVAHRSLKDDGIFLFHTMGISHHDFPVVDPWFNKYIFPNGIFPYHKQITEHIDKKFILEDWQNFGNDYGRTVDEWYDKFVDTWPQIQHKYGEKFFRMWTFYLKVSSGLFRARKVQLWQVVLSKDGIEGGYYGGR